MNKSGTILNFSRSMALLATRDDISTSNPSNGRSGRMSVSVESTDEVVVVGE